SNVSVGVNLNSQSKAPNVDWVGGASPATDTYNNVTSSTIYDSLEVAVKYLKKAGFSNEDIFVGGASPQKANLVVRYRGTGEMKPLLLLAHT
ncbi:hypothetical protein MXE00_15925, partial [Legionella pneumophila]|nr:hypothetical protein [Legionella pneumophila]